MAGLLDDEELMPFFGNPNIQRQGARARALAAKRDVNTLPDPRTYAAISGLLGQAPDEMGFSVLNPDYEGIQRVARPAFAAGTALGIAPMMRGMNLAPRPAVRAPSAESQAGMIVFHGSPAKFSKFDPAKIGTGEGAQSFGYGHYVAENPEVARGYQKKLAKESQATDLNTRMGLVDVGGTPLTTFNVDMDAALIDAAKAGKKDFVSLAKSKKTRWDQLSKDQTYQFQNYAKQKSAAYQNLLNATKKNDVAYTGSGSFYEIDLPDEQIARMLNFDQPVDEAIRSRVSQAAMEKFGSGSTGTSGELLYKELTREFKNAGSANPAADASEFLRMQEVPGIRFLDQGSRAGGAGTSNFVVFPGNENLLNIKKRNEDLLGLFD